MGASVQSIGMVSTGDIKVTHIRAPGRPTSLLGRLTSWAKYHFQEFRPYLGVLAFLVGGSLAIFCLIATTMQVWQISRRPDGYVLATLERGCRQCREKHVKEDSPHVKTQEAFQGQREPSVVLTDVELPPIKKMSYKNPAPTTESV